MIHGILIFILKHRYDRREEENINKPQNQKIAPKCPLCNNKLTNSSIFKIHLNIDNNSSMINEQLIVSFYLIANIRTNFWFTDDAH